MEDPVLAARDGRPCQSGQLGAAARMAQQSRLSPRNVDVLSQASLAPQFAAPQRSRVVRSAPEARRLCDAKPCAGPAAGCRWSRALTRALRLETLSVFFFAGMLAVATGGALARTSPKVVVGAVAAVVLLVAAVREPRWLLRLIPLSFLVPPFIALKLHGLPDQTATRALVVTAALVLVLASTVAPSGLRGIPRGVAAVAAAYAVFLLALAFVSPNVATVRGAFALGAGAFVPSIFVYSISRRASDLWYLAIALVAALDVAAVLAMWEELRRSYLFASHDGVFFHVLNRGGL